MTNPLEHLEVLLIVGIAGFAGANLRYLFELLVPSLLVATAAANVVGCLALGFLFYGGEYGDSISRPARTVIATGFISSFTTYSTFVVDAARADPTVAVAYVAGTYALGFLAVLAGRGLVVFLGAGETLTFFLGIGLCGSFTTYSSFSVETVRLRETGDRLRAVAYAGGTLGVCLGGVLAAWLIAELGGI